MKQLPSSFLLQNSFLYCKKALLFLAVVVHCLDNKAQVVNYISNGSFEEVVTNTATPLFYSAKYWGGIDSSKYYGVTLSAIIPPIKVPFCSYTYQWPKHGNNDLITTLYSADQYNNRGYPRNRLKEPLKNGKTYCFSMYINLSNNSINATDAIGVYFGDSAMDTISQCNFPITYLVPQIQNQTSNIINDTLNWILVRGQFTAIGTEKYALIGNFKTNANTNTVLANPTYTPAINSDYLLDYVSLIEIDLDAYAGRDTTILSGDSVFIGRQPDVGIDEACIWFKHPGTTPIDTVAGFWVKPSATSTYVVRQEICGLVKWDTIVIRLDYVGLKENKTLRGKVDVFPNPAQDQLYIVTANSSEILQIMIADLTGRVVKRQELRISENKGILKLGLFNGAYLITIVNSQEETVTKQLLISN